MFRRLSYVWYVCGKENKSKGMKGYQRSTPCSSRRVDGLEDWSQGYILRGSEATRIGFYEKLEDIWGQIRHLNSAVP